MNIEKFILAAIALDTSKVKVSGGTPLFSCSSKEEMDSIASSLEAILDGIAHEISENLYIIVKH
ncbi:capping complex subunit for YIEGIA [Bacillus sp. JJ1562]|uniref:capping complex subunit for YIEGIA n=1 Tax=Bacillus sp. JJ1562 TaxID=3122960 RepID=UPI00300119D8